MKKISAFNLKNIAIIKPTINTMAIHDEQKFKHKNYPHL
jgi:hypothetical protein